MLIYGRCWFLNWNAIILNGFGLKDMPVIPKMNVWMLWHVENGIKISLIICIGIMDFMYVASMR